MSTIECIRCKRHVSIYYINKDDLCWDCTNRNLEFLKYDSRFDIPKMIFSDPYKKTILERNK